MPAPFRLGLVGAGRMGMTHLHAIADSNAVAIVAVTEPSPTPALRASGIALHADLDAMLAAGGLDGVLVAVPSGLHLPVVTRLAEAGLPILCEKPCGLISRHAEDAAAVAARCGVPLQVAYWRRFVPELQALRSRIISGAIGGIYFVASYQWDGTPPSAAFRAGSGGIFVDMGVHEFDQVRWLTGQDFTRVVPAISRISADPPVPGDSESAQALCEMSGGSAALISCGRRFDIGDICRVEVFGTLGHADCRFLWPPEGDAVFTASLRHQAEGFAAWVRGGPLLGATAEDAVAALRAAEEASTSLHA